ncbi:MAG: NAD(P)-dependent oxidoreductase [Candidatus Omnitrophota bacterium]|nr:MAG: NAD(P)-dependent oxidoreductase [Candidatus Omnitrophota bacterium]
MQKVLVTGGSGFFGVFLVRRLLDKKYRLKVLDAEDISNHEIKEKIEFIKGDVRDKRIIKEICKDVDCVFHNAAVLPISRSKKRIFWEVNIDGTRNVLDASLCNKVKKTVFISSSAPYGIPQEIPITEDTEFNPVCDYGRSKIEAEKICNEYRDRGLDIIILRPRTIVGKGRLGLFQILYSWIADNKNIYIIGKGNNLFSFLSERDLVNACILSIEKDCKNEDFNLGTDRFRTVKEDLGELINYAKSSSKIVSLPAKLAKIILRALDIFNLSPFTAWHYKTPDKPFYFDITKAQKILGWQPEMSNFDMFKDSYDWYLSHREEVDFTFGITHTKSVRQRILKVLKSFS